MGREPLERRYGNFGLQMSLEAEDPDPLYRRYGDLVVLTRRGRVHELRWGCTVIPAGSTGCYIATAVEDTAFLGYIIGYPGVFAVIFGFVSLLNAAVGRWYIDGDL